VNRREPPHVKTACPVKHDLWAEQCLSICQTQRDTCDLRTPTPPSPCLFRSRCLFGGYDHSLTECLLTVSPHPASPFWSVDCSSVYWRPFSPRIKVDSPHANATSQFRSIGEVGAGREYGIRSRPTAMLWPSYWILVSVIGCVRTLISLIGISRNSRIGLTLAGSHYEL